MDLEPGQYVLSFRWDSKCTPQVWMSVTLLMSSAQLVLSIHFFDGITYPSRSLAFLRCGHHVAIFLSFESSTIKANIDM